MIELNLLDSAIKKAPRVKMQEAIRQIPIVEPQLLNQIEAIADSLRGLIYRIANESSEPNLVEELKTSLYHLEKIKSSTINQYQSFAGHARIAVNQTLGAFFVKNVLPNLQKDFPLIQFEFREGSQIECLQNLNDNHVDIAVTTLKRSDEVIEQHMLFEEELYLYVSPLHPFIQKDLISLDDLNINDVILMSPGNALRNLSLHWLKFRPESDALKIRQDFNINSLSTLKHCVEGGRYYTFIPKLSAQYFNSYEKSLLRRVVNPAPFRRVYLTSLKNYKYTSILAAIKSEFTQAMNQF